MRFGKVQERPSPEPVDDALRPVGSVFELGDQPVDPNLPASAAQLPSAPWPPAAASAPAAASDGRPLPVAGSGAPPTLPPTTSGPGRRPWPRRFVPRTLAARLTTGVVALVLVIVMAVGTSTYVALNLFLTNRFDQQLQGVASSSSGLISRCIVTAAGCGFKNQSVHGPQKQWLAIYDQSGSLIDLKTSPNADSSIELLQPTTAQSTQLLDHIGEPINLRATSDGESLRVVAVQTQSGLVVAIGMSTDEMDTTLHRLVLLELVIGAGAVVVAFLLTTYGVRLSLRQLNNVTRTAQAVTAELSPDGSGLDRRVPVTETDTEVGKLAGSVNTLLGAVEQEFAARVESEDRMRQFLADASHELRTPLVSIRGYAELARMQRQRGAEQSAEASADALDRIEGEGTRMSRLVDDLLILARSDRGAVLHHDSISVPTLIDDVVTGVRAAHPSREITVAAQPGLTLFGDHDQLLRVLRNLVTNAAIHTADGPIAVRGFGDGQQIVLQVQDSGPGLAPEDAAQVFGRFWRADKARTRVRGGSGLGLSIVASIVQAHGGNVTFVSSIDEGSTVTVVLPLTAPRALSAPENAPLEIEGDIDAR